MRLTVNGGRVGGRPQASDKLRAEWPGMDSEAMACLRAGGWVLTPDWCWAHPEDRELTDRERSAVAYLVDEWDFGGTVKWEGRE